MAQEGHLHTCLCLWPSLQGLLLLSTKPWDARLQSLLLLSLFSFATDQKKYPVLATQGDAWSLQKPESWHILEIWDLGPPSQSQ